MRYVRYCPSCPCAAQCRDAFGAFWKDKSAGGVGCNTPFDGRGAIVPPPHAVDEEHIVGWIDEYVRRAEINRARFEKWTPQELDMAVRMKYPGRFRGKYTK